jgi:hypothetical protein
MDGMGWDGMGWDAMRWDVMDGGMGYMVCDGMDDGMRWDEMGGDAMMVTGFTPDQMIPLHRFGAVSREIFGHNRSRS